MGDRFVQVTYRMRQWALWVGHYRLGAFVIVPRFFPKQPPYFSITLPRTSGGCLVLWVGPFGVCWRLW